MTTLAGLRDHIRKAFVKPRRSLAQILCTSAVRSPESEATGRGSEGKELITISAAESATKGPAQRASPIRIGVTARPILQYGRDLTTLAAEGRFDGLCDRPREINRLEKILQRMQKRNCVLTGEAGAGKTALVELLSRRIARGEVAPPLMGLRVHEIRMGELVAGTKYRGQFEERVKGLLDTVERSEHTILFIDETHLLWGAGRAEGAPMDAANMFKPVLARGKVRVIGATTIEEYDRHIAQDPALARRFQEIRLDPADPELVFQMVRAQADQLAEYHHVLISDQTIRHAVELTDRHLAARSQPDKARDLLDDTCVTVSSRGASEICDTDLLEVLSEKTRLPITQLTEKDREQLRELPAKLKERIIGQDHAVKTVSARITQRRQGFNPGHRNLGAFLFAGSTGVGKTELARAIAEVFFQDTKALLHLDMAEYCLPTAIHKLLGAPAGYVGSEKEGMLPKWLRSRGSGVILFDEIEKAHEDVWFLLLSLLDEGRIHSGRGEPFDTRQCVVILTTNVLTSDDLQAGTLGFTMSKAKPDPVELLARHFPREFLARLDEAILFNAFSRQDMRTIAALRIAEAIGALRGRGLRIVCNEIELVDYVVARLENTGTGARGIAALVEKEVIHPISAALLNRSESKGIRIKLNGGFSADGSVVIKVGSSPEFVG